MTSGEPALLVDLTSPKNKTSHSTSGLANSFALEVDTSCTCEILLAPLHDDSSTLHKAVVSAIAEPAPTNAMAINAARTARPNILICFIASPFGLTVPSSLGTEPTAWPRRNGFQAPIARI